MITIRPGSQRGHFNHGWLDTFHTFSFGDYYDRSHMAFRSLRVMNEDRVDPGMGFGMHGHKDMEIVTYVLSGALQHKDSLGNGEVLRPGELQRMTAGSGIQHSEFNPSPTEPVHLYQIWLLPETKGLTPSYEQRAFDISERKNRLRVVASPDARDGSLLIHQDAFISLADLDEGKSVDVQLGADRHSWIQVLRGTADVGGHTLTAGDGAAISGEKSVTVRAGTAAEVMVFDMN